MYETLMLKSEAAKCFLCENAPCDAACPYGVGPAKRIRSIRFENTAAAVQGLSRKNGICVTCPAPCQEACLCAKTGSPIQIRSMLIKASAGKREPDEEKKAEKEADLSVDFCGIKFENPFLLSSSIVGSNEEMIARAFDMGWAGVAVKTIGAFIPEETSPRFAAIGKEGNPFIGFKNIEQISDHSMEENFTYIRNLKKRYPDKVILASIMGRNEEEWTMLARRSEEAGADMIECNFSCPHMSGGGLGSDVGTNPELVRAYTEAVRKGSSLPVLAKMTPNITNMEIPAEAAVQAGADGLAAINTIKSVMNVSLDTFVSQPDVSGKSCEGGYSGKAVKPVALRFIRDLKSDPALAGVPVSGMGGIETWRDAAEFLALGCGTVQVTTAIMQYGYRIIDDLISGLADYLKQSGISSVRNLIGRGLDGFAPAEELDRHSVQYPRFDRRLCVGCGRCSISCADGGHQAIRMKEDRKPVMDPNKCVGCQLCRLVCPVGAIGIGKRVGR